MERIWLMAFRPKQAERLVCYNIAVDRIYCRIVADCISYLVQAKTEAGNSFEASNQVGKEEEVDIKLRIQVNRRKLMMTTEQAAKEEKTYSFKEILYNTTLGRATILGCVIAGLVLCYKACDHKLSEMQRPIVGNVRGNEKPETYVEVNGVKDYSHIDGKDLSDLVKE